MFSGTTAVHLGDLRSVPADSGLFWGESPSRVTSDLGIAGTGFWDRMQQFFK